MPFESTKLHDSHTVILPPTGEPGRGPRRIVLNITIEQRQQSPHRGHRFGSLLGWLLLLILLASLAHAQQRQASPTGPVPNWQGGSYSVPDNSGGTYTWPQDQSQNGGHGCHSYTGGDGVVRTDCW